MTIQDEIFRVYGVQINDALAIHFGKLKGESLQDAELRWLKAQPGADSDTINDLWFEVLRVAGHQGTINDMKLSYWQAQ